MFLGYSLIFLPIAYQPILSHFFTFLPHGLWEKAPGRRRGSPGWTADAETLRRQWQELPWCRSGSGSLLTMEQTHTMNTVLLWNSTFFFLWTDIIVSWPWRPGYIPTIYHTTITYIKEQTSLLDTKYIHPVKNHIFIKLSAWQMGGWLWRSRARHSCLRASVGFHSQAVKSGDGNCFLAYEGDTPEVWNVQLESFFL